MLLAAASDVAAAPATTAEELLHLWNLDAGTNSEPALDPAAVAAAEESYGRAAHDVRAPRGSTSMTPNLDRLLATPRSGVATGIASAKGGSGSDPSTDTRNRRRCRLPCRHWPRCGYTPPPPPPPPPPDCDPPNPVPEPASLLLFGAAAATAAGIKARRKRNGKPTP
jgi:hypothetical protein